MEQKIVAKMPLSTALLLLGQLVPLIGDFEAKIHVQHREIGCRCNTRVLKTVKKALSSCCPYLFDEQATVEAMIPLSDDVAKVLQAFNIQSLSYATTL